MAKRSNPNTPPVELPKDCSYLEYLKEDAFRFFPGKQEWRSRVCASLYSFPEEKDEFKMPVVEVMQFCELYKIPYTTLLMWVNMYDDISHAYKYMKLRLASRRRIGALHRRYDKDVVFKDLHNYDPEWDAVNKYHAALKTDQVATGPQFILMSEMPTSSKVKDKK